ncbi:MAG: UDP-2,4-diacetamido-2,4, 6-trideoxy-beta-L-altropyranose hydrolase [Candidatus Celerinatantimonas neptuna]|nr:MAG: UDP-2,4-diacetamido-2,4, 6-trideoxy-beta-L-altropyranose hydrolase [Candidatus Celerinatantimonas neptuna]
MIKILFRLDANSQIGTGHLMRCLTLADALSQHAKDNNQTLTCCFYCHQLPPALAEWVVKRGHIYLEAAQLQSKIDPILDWQSDVVIVDHYGLDANWENQLYGKIPLLVIDDLANRSHQCNWLLDQGPLRQSTDYTSVNQGCQFWLGSRFALIAPEFHSYRRSNCGPFRQGLICFGGADPVHATKTTLEALLKLERAKSIQWHIIAGAANPDWPDLLELVQFSSLAIHIKRHESNMPRLLAQCDFTIGAAGGMTWERCCIGIPTLAIPIVDNQVFNEAVIRRYQLAELLSLDDLSQPEQLDSALKSLESHRNLFRKHAQTMIDGLGAIRIATKLLHLLR